MLGSGGCLHGSQPLLVEDQPPLVIAVTVTIYLMTGASTSASTSTNTGAGACAVHPNIIISSVCYRRMDV